MPDSLVDSIWKFHGLRALRTVKQKKEELRAKEKVEKEFCPHCKKRIEKIVCLVEGTFCMRMYKKISGQGKYRGVRCMNFKRIPNETKKTQEI